MVFRIRPYRTAVGYLNKKKKRKEKKNDVTTELQTPKKKTFTIFFFFNRSIHAGIVLVLNICTILSLFIVVIHAAPACYY